MARYYNIDISKRQRIPEKKGGCLPRHCPALDVSQKKYEKSYGDIFGRGRKYRRAQR
jgi:hypothetical protein